MNIIQKFKETLGSVVPIMVIVLLLGLTVAPLDAGLLVRFVSGGVLLIIGLTIFLLGVDIGIQPVGEKLGAVLTAKRNLPLLLVIAFIIGFMVTVAEPDVQVLADQIKNVSADINKWTLIIMIATGIGLFVSLGLLRTILSIPLNAMLIISYAVVFLLAYFCPTRFQGVAFDAGGATTGPMTVPFIMSLGIGVANVRSEKKTSDNADSFGLTGLASIGPVAAVLVYGVAFSALKNDGGTKIVADSVSQSSELAASGLFGLASFINLVPEVFHEVISALAPLIVLFAFFQLFLLKMPPMQLKRMIQGLIYSFVGLLLFLTGVKGGFMPAGESLGRVLGNLSVNGNIFYKVLLIAVGFVFGAVVVCAEPAVWVLTDQVEKVSGGNIKRRIMLAALSIGVAFSIAISIVRIMVGFSLWYIIIPGYVLSLLMTLLCPKLFTAIAFDSGGVASGPMTSTFILSFTLGVSAICGKTSASDAFGVIALVALTPLVAIQVLGIMYAAKKKRGENKI